MASSSVNQLVDLLNENQGVVDVVLFFLALAIAWFSGFIKWLWRQRLVSVICAWTILAQHAEDDDFIKYEFIPTFQNKSNQIIKDFWINFSTSGFDLEIEDTKQMVLFDGWNMHNEAMHLVTKSEYRFPPQNLLEPFKIKTKLRKQLPNHDAWLYLSYGAPNVKRVEINARVTYKKLNEFIKGNDHSTIAFLKLMGLAKKIF